SSTTHLSLSPSPLKLRHCDRSSPSNRSCQPWSRSSARNWLSAAHAPKPGSASRRAYSRCLVSGVGPLPAAGPGAGLQALAGGGAFPEVGGAGRDDGGGIEGMVVFDDVPLGAGPRRRGEDRFPVQHALAQGRESPFLGALSGRCVVLGVHREHAPLVLL